MRLGNRAIVSTPAAPHQGISGVHDKIGALPFCIPLRAHMLSLTLNGAPREVASPCTILALLEQLELVGKRVAVERNGEIVPRGQHASTVLQEGDALEIVVAVGGG